MTKIVSQQIDQITSKIEESFKESVARRSDESQLKEGEKAVKFTGNPKVSLGEVYEGSLKSSLASALKDVDAEKLNSVLQDGDKVKEICDKVVNSGVVNPVRDGASQHFRKKRANIDHASRISPPVAIVYGVYEAVRSLVHKANHNDIIADEFLGSARVKSVNRNVLNTLSASDELLKEVIETADKGAYPPYLQRHKNGKVGDGSLIVPPSEELQSPAIAAHYFAALVKAELNKDKTDAKDSASEDKKSWTHKVSHDQDHENYSGR